MHEYVLKKIPEDFRVTEVPFVPELLPKEQSAHTYVRLDKVGSTTFEATDAITKHFSLSHGDVSAEGLKDEFAVTQQIISIRGIVEREDLELFNKRHSSGHDYIRLKNIIGYGLEAVPPRKLHGNTFSIVVRSLSKKNAEALHNLVTENRFIPFVNYYDNQRFGMDGGPYNTHLIGKAITENDWVSAGKEIALTKNLPKDTNVPSTQEECKALFQTFNPQMIKFFVSSYSSALWNEKVSKEVESQNEGEHKDFEHVGKLFLPNDINFTSPTSCEVDSFRFEPEPYAAEPTVYKRNLIFQTIFFPSEISDDDMHPGKYKLDLSFFLTSGSYATMAVQQLMMRIK